MAETEAGERLLLDGTLLPTGNRAGQQGQGLYSGKRHKAGMNVQVIGDRWGRLLDVSDPTPGSMHDARSFATTGLAALLADRAVLADLGFLGCGVSTPVRKPPGGKLCELEKVNNRAHASVRGGGADHRAAQAVEGVGDGVSGAAGQVSQGDPDGGRVGKVQNLRKAF